MQLLRLEVQNWCQHRHRVCNFTRGLVAIIGRIGSGKSNILGAIRWCLTGDNPNAGVKMDNVSQLSAEDEPSFAQLEFEHRGHLVAIKRFLRPEKEQSVLTLDGQETARGDKAVTAYIERILGIDSKFIGRFILVAQNEIFSFIEDERSEVDRFFQRLFDTAKAEKISDLLGKHASKTTIPEILVPSTQLALQVDELSDKIDQLKVETKKLPTIERFLKEQEEDQKVIKEWDDRNKAIIEKNELQQKFVAAEKQFKTVEAECARHEKDLAALTAAANGHEESHAEARVALGHWASYKKIAKAKEELQVARNAIVEKRAKNPEVPFVDNKSIELALAAYHAIEHDLNSATKFVKVFSQQGLAACPTCHTPTKDLQSYLIGQKQAVEDLTAKAAKSKEELEKLSLAQQARQAWERLDRDLAARELQLQETEKQLTDVTPPELSEEQLQQIVSDYESFQSVKQEIEPIFLSAKERKAQLSGALSSIRDRLAQVTADIASAVTTESDVQLIKVKLDTMREQCAKRQSLEQACKQLEFERTKLVENYDKTKEAELQAVKLRSWLETIDVTRSALKSAPRIVASRNLAKLEAAINDLLQIFGVDFFVSAADDGSPTFIAEFFDGRKQPARRLSYGQKTVLALAFRVAVNSMFAEEIGLLVLDEPTAYLDQQRIRALAPVLEKLRDLSTARGLQCVIVTHESGLSHLFESTIELDAK